MYHFADRCSTNWANAPLTLYPALPTNEELTTEQAIGHLIQHLIAMHEEKIKPLYQLKRDVAELKEQINALHDRVLLLEKQWGATKRDEAQSEKQSTAKRKTQSSKRKPE